MELKKRVIIFQTEISAYNGECYNIISDSYDLTLAYFAKDKSAKECRFKKVKLESCKLGPFHFVKGVRELAKQYDIVCIPPNFHLPSYCVLPFLPHKYKIISWSIGFRVSYVHPYRTERMHNILDWCFKKVLEICDANVFYMEKAKEFWKGTSLDMTRVFVAPNTTDVVTIELKPEIKKDFLFVGTLYKGKGLDLLLDAFRKVVEDHNSTTKLNIVGDGSERNSLEDYVKSHNLTENVVFHGAIYDEKELAKQFAHALLCISPTQGGLSVPKSMGYGVPFVTRKDAITGGEIYHITSGLNGIMYDKDEDLVNILTDACLNPQKYVNMGKKAKEYYDNHATIRHMAQGAMEAFEHVMNR